MSNFVILASARTGSSSLSWVLGESPDVKMAIEPFHEGFPEWNPGEKKYIDLIKDATTMNAALDELFSKYTAIKVLDYQLDEDIYFTMLLRKDIKILFLTRRNLIAMALSSQVAEQTNRYHKGKDNSIYESLQPVDIEAMEKEIEYIGSLNKSFAKFLDAHRPDDHLKLYYEELYSEDLETNKRTLKKICDFLSVSLPNDSAIEKYMIPSNAQISHNDLYKKVPNYNEVIARFGKI